MRLGDIIKRILGIDWVSVEAQLKHMLFEAEAMGKEALHEYGDIKALIATITAIRLHAENLQPQKNVEVKQDLFHHLDIQELVKLKTPEDLIKILEPLIKK